MLGVEVWLNGERLGLCGDPAIASMHAIVGVVPARDLLDLNVGGMLRHGPDDDEYLSWLRRELQPGDRIELRIVEGDAFMAPSERRREGPELLARAKRR